MVQDRAGGPALVLENKNVPETAVALEVKYTVAVGPEDFLDLAFGQVLEPERVLRALDDDLMSADTVHPIIDAAPLALEGALDMEDRKLARNDAHPPAGCIGKRLLSAERCNLRGGLCFVARAERAFRRGDIVELFLKGIIFGLLGPFGGDNDPAADDGVLSQS